MLSIFLETAEITQKVAQKFAKCANIPAIITFSGEIGAGKTSFIRSFIQQLGIKEPVKSPTFTLVESYQLESLPIHHFDLYRIVDDSELDYIGFRDYMSDALCCIEWPERVHASNINADLEFSFKIDGHGRLLTVKPSTSRGEKIVACWMQWL